MSFKFIKEPDPDSPYSNAKITHEVLNPDATVDDLLQEFKEFLSGCGYGIDFTSELVILEKGEYIGIADDKGN